MLEFIQNNLMIIIAVLLIGGAALVGLIADGIIKKKKKETKEEGVETPVTSEPTVEVPAMDIAEAAVMGAVAATVVEDLTAPLETEEAPAVAEEPLPEDIYTPIEEVPVLAEETVVEAPVMEAPATVVVEETPVVVEAPVVEDTIISVLDTPVEESFDFVSNVTSEAAAEENFDFYPETAVEEAPVVDSISEEAVVTPVEEEIELPVVKEQPVEMVDESAFFNSHSFDEEVVVAEEAPAVEETPVVNEADSFFAEVEAVAEETVETPVVEEVALPEVDTAENAAEPTEDDEWKF